MTKGLVTDKFSLSLRQVGEEGAGHFVKMVHNGIEYGDMQLICEAYHVMKGALGLDNDKISEVSVFFISSKELFHFSRKDKKKKYIWFICFIVHV